MYRPSKQEYYLSIAREVSNRSTCLRCHFGAVIVNDDEIVSTGYNGAPRGALNCIDVGECPREKQGVPSGQRYELCRSVHAEANACISAARKYMMGSYLYLYGYHVIRDEVLFDAMPCRMCKRIIMNAGIYAVVCLSNETGTRVIKVSSWIDDGSFDVPDSMDYAY